MKTNTERANHGPKTNQPTRIAHQLRQCELRDQRTAAVRVNQAVK
jgi:hypothetical protein